MNLDEVLVFIGAYGRYQVIVYLLISLFDNFLSIWHMSVMAFLGYEPQHYCKVSPLCCSELGGVGRAVQGGVGRGRAQWGGVEPSGLGRGREGQGEVGRS